jgi:predicted nucleotidyltransferase
MDLNAAIDYMVAKIVNILKANDPSVYLYGSCVLNDFHFGWSDIDILVLTQIPITDQQANQLLFLRQECQDTHPATPLFRCFEGGMLALDSFRNHTPTTVVYWGTSGQRITDHYTFDACSLRELLDHGQLMYGKDIRNQLTPPTFADLKANIQVHYNSIRKYASLTGRSIYSFGWILDIARGIYTLRTGKIISKTAAGYWALENRLFTDCSALETALEVRKNPQLFHDDSSLQDLAENLGPMIQQYAAVLEYELSINNAAPRP